MGEQGGNRSSAPRPGVSAQPPTPPAPRGSAFNTRQAAPLHALTGSPDCAAPRSCEAPDAGCGCYEDACVRRRHMSEGVPTASARGGGQGADGGLSTE